MATEKKITWVDDTQYISGTATGITIETDNTLVVNCETSATFDSPSVVFTSSTANKPVVEIKNTTNDANGSILKFIKDKGAAGAANDVSGLIQFFADDAAQQQVMFSEIKSQVKVHTNGQEGGKLTVSVAEHDGTSTAGLIIEDGDADGELDVTLGAGDSSLVKIPGYIYSSNDSTIDSNNGIVGPDFVRSANPTQRCFPYIYKTGHEIVTVIKLKLKGLASNSRDTTGDTQPNANGFIGKTTTGTTSCFFYKIQNTINGLIYKAEMVCSQAPTAANNFETVGESIGISYNTRNDYTTKRDDQLNNNEVPSTKLIDHSSQILGKTGKNGSDFTTSLDGMKLYLYHNDTNARDSYTAGELIVKLYGMDISNQD